MVVTFNKPADADDVFEMGRLWSKVYNTRFPAQPFIDDYRRYVEDVSEAQISALRPILPTHP